MKFKKEDLHELASYKGKVDGFEVVQNELIDNSRWSLLYDLVFKAPDGKFYLAGYSRGATESQDESPFEKLFRYFKSQCTCAKYCDLKSLICI